MKNILYTIILSLISTNLLADATQGEMFGFKIGGQYKENGIPVDDLFFYIHRKDYSDAVTLTWKVPVKDAVKPKNYGDVSIYISKMTHTIVRIECKTCFKNHEDMRHFAETQYLVFDNLYFEKPNVKVYMDKRPLDHYGSGLEFLDIEDREFYINIYTGRPKKYCAFINIMPRPDFRLESIIKNEHDQLLIKYQGTEGL
tara:strand:- start:513 stop:1109 length:597 start_codon:yes stop_codon:yes gene_type:complete